ncbi:MAG: hypothetical protein AB1560_01120 [Pseudomonadota bacterium]
MDYVGTAKLLKSALNGAPAFIFVMLALTVADACIAAPAVNMIHNSSFEAGIDYRFSVGRWYVTGLPDVQLDPATRVHGRYSARVPYARQPDGRAGMMFRSAVPVHVTAGTAYTFSVHLKADAHLKAELNLVTGASSEKSVVVAGKQITIGKSWDRFSVTFTPVRTQEIYWDVEVKADTPGYFWIDALQMEAGNNATAYHPAMGVESGIVSGRLGKIYDPDEPAEIRLMAYNDAPGPADNRSFRLQVFDLDGQSVFSGTMVQSLPAQQGIDVPVRLNIGKNGVYRALLFSGANPQPEGVLHFSVLPRPRKIPAAEGAFGAYITLSPEPLDIMRRLGFTWIGNLTSNNYVILWQGVEPREGDYQWHDQEVDRARERGYEFMFNLEPCRAPQWALSLSREERLRKWTRYVEAMVRHYGARVKYWTVGDEVHAKTGCWANPAEYAAWHVAAHATIKSVDPGARVIMNSSSTFAADLLNVLPGSNVDILAGNFYHMPVEILRMQRIAQANQMQRLWAPGVGASVLPYYQEHLSADQKSRVTGSYWNAQADELTKSVVRTFAYGAERLLHYTATFVGNTNNYSLFEADSGLKPNGAQFGALITLLDGFVRAREVPARAGENVLSVYRFDRRDGTTVFPVWSDIAAAQVLTIADGGRPETVIVYDRFMNALPVKSGAGRLSFDAGRHPVFIVVPGYLGDFFETALGSVSNFVEAVPAGESSIVKERYARVDGISGGTYRGRRNVSLWHKTSGRGWMEIMRERSSTYLPDYRVTSGGFEIEWDFMPGQEDFQLQPGAFPASLMEGARVWGLNRSGERVERFAGQIDLARNAVTPISASPPYPLTTDGSSIFLIQTKHGLLVKVQTIATSSVKTDKNEWAPGTWRLLVKDGQCFLHGIFRHGQPGPVKIKTVVSITERTR